MRRFAYGIAAIAIFISDPAFSECIKQNWNGLLDLQMRTEHHYNQYSTEFNQILSTYDSQLLFSKRYAPHQLVELWANDDPKFTQRLKHHMASAYQASSLLLKQAHLSQMELVSARELTESWQSMYDSCKQQNKPKQSHNAQLHFNSSKSLVVDFENLINKTRKLAEKYHSEADILNNTRKQAAPY